MRRTSGGATSTPGPPFQTLSLQTQTARLTLSMKTETQSGRPSHCLQRMALSPRLPLRPRPRRRRPNSCLRAICWQT